MTHYRRKLSQILVKIAKSQQNGQKNLVVFDLDSTLFDVSPRLQQILQIFAELPETQKKFPEQATLLKEARTERGDWGIIKALERVGLHDTNHEFHHDIKKFWFECFFSNEYLHFDQPFEGAVDFVQNLFNSQAHIVYLTGRDIARMQKGSEETLLKWNFPLNPPQAELVLKPHKSMDDAAFKTMWFENQKDKNYQNIIFFENEPMNIIPLQQSSPEVEIIFMDSTHAGRMSPPEGLTKIIDFLAHSEDEP